MKRGPEALSTGQRVGAPLAAALVATGLVALLSYLDLRGALRVPGVRAWELATIDARYRLRRARPADPRIVIVGLDDRTRAEAPALMQTRRGLARLLDAIAAAEPAAIGIDAFFAAPEVNLEPATITAVVRAEAELAALPAPSPREVGALAALRAVREETRGDEVLGEAIARAGNVYLAALFTLEGEPAPDGAAEPAGLAAARYPEAVVTAAAAAARPPAAAAGLALSLPAIARGAAGAGYVNVIADEDGVVRRAALVIERGGRYYRPLALALHQALTGQAAAYLTSAREVRLGAGAVAVDRRGVAWLDFVGPGGSFAQVSAAAVLAGEVPPAALAGKVVLIGYTDKARDLATTPLSARFPGVELHATLLHDLLAGRLIGQTGPGATALTILALGGALALCQLGALRRRRAALTVATLALVGLGYLVLAQVLLGRGLIVAVVWPGLALVTVALAALATAAATEGRDRARLRAVFSQYVAAPVVEHIALHPERLRLGGERRELTVLFSDLCDFTSLSEGLEPEVLAEVLSDYLSPMTELVMAEGGMLDKYIGDAIMAVFGAPLAAPDHARAACRAALAMRDALGPINQALAARGRPTLAMGIGVNSGPMAVGNMGSAARFDYTVLGDAVNLGARLESLTRTYGVAILIGEATAAALGDEFVVREIDRVRVRGRAQITTVYELVGRAGSAEASVATRTRYAEALAAYRAGDFAAAAALTAAAACAAPDDGPLGVLGERARALAAAPPAAWDGVFEQLAK